MVTCISWGSETGWWRGLSADRTLKGVARGELSLALNTVSSLSGTSEYNLESNSSEFIPKREIGVVVISLVVL